MKILCIGRNYDRHVREMGDVSGRPAEPVVFLKPPTAMIRSGTVVLPPQSSDVQHEVELVARVGTTGKNIPEAQALYHIDAYAIGIDVTARDIQSKAKEARGPWTVAKGFDTFAPVGPFAAAKEIGDPQDIRFGLRVNGETRQEGWAGDMMFFVAYLVSFLSTVFTLEEGDLVFTGTPEGVGPIRDGDRLEAWGTGLETLVVTAVR